MLRNFGKFILYLILSCAISGLAYWTGSDFINKFSGSAEASQVKDGITAF